MKNKSAVFLYTVYKHPTDFPDKWAMRAFIVSAKAINPSSTVITGDSLEEIRSHLPRGLTRMDRHPEDDPIIYETWI